jgi:putative tryptophan/tyrosine transport system substrate-binding protein
MGPTLEATRTVPIIFAFAIVPDPVGSGYVKSLSRPGGNATGFMMFEYSLYGKWPALLKEIAPHTTRAAVLRGPAVPIGIGQFAVIQSVAGSVGVEVLPVNLSDAAEIAREVADFAQSANDCLLLTASALSAANRDLIITLAGRHKLPAICHERTYADTGGLISYGPNFPRSVPASRGIRRSHPQGREARRPAGAGADQIRVGDQSEDGEGARVNDSIHAARPS